MVALGALGVFSHIKSRDFVRRRMRFTRLVEKPAIGIAAGLAATFVAAPVVAVLPFVGAGTAIAFGAGVGTGVHVGAKRAARGLLED
ncbi:MAG: hypothetical protein D6701_05105 [Gemmatimonadetes bacterium]|nr:MAG: hypothetical protein D6701_05105 [Gemmatimonadota bacterium]